MRLWMPIIITPLVVLAQQSANYALVAVECAKQQRFAIHVVSSVSLAIAVAGILLAWSAWRAAGTAPPDDQGTGVSRVRFLAAVGVALSALMALSILAQWLTTAFVPPCLE
jgi:hypothetical protein